MKITRGEKIMKTVIYIILVFLAFIMIYPFWNSLVISLNDATDALRGGLTFWPREFSLESYKFLFEQSDEFLQAFKISILRTVIGTVLSILCTSIFAYGLSKPQLKYRNFYTKFCVFTMYFNGGIIPVYLLIKTLGLINSFWVYIFPWLIVVWNMIIFRSFFSTLPQELEESAKLDGAGYYTILFRIVYPVSTPVLATLALFTAVWQWNSWFDAAIYITDDKLIPVQTLLREVINANKVEEMIAQTVGGGSGITEQELQTKITTRSLTLSTMIVATLPVIMVYPFLQRYFTKGIMIGSLKG